jgi:hypothetical protein
MQSWHSHDITTGLQCRALRGFWGVALLRLQLRHMRREKIRGQRKKGSTIEKTFAENGAEKK